MMKILKLERSITFTKWFVITYVLMLTWVARHQMNPDGISYLDIADAYLKRSPDAINAYWSPAYSWLMAVFLWAFKPSLYWEFPLVHLANLFIFIFTFVSFGFFMKTFIQYLESIHKSTDTVTYAHICLFGYVLFTWSMMHSISIDLVTPDLMLNGLIYLVFVLLLKIKMNPQAPFASYIFFGLVLGASYLCKSVMFVLAFCFIGLLFSGRAYRQKTKLMSCLIAFVLMTSPLVYQISKKEHGFTFGTSAKQNYYQFVTNYYSDKRASVDGFQTYSTAAKSASMPFHYEPDSREARISFDIKKQCAALVRNLKVYYHICYPILAPFFIFVFFIGFSKPVLTKLNFLLPVIIPSLFGLMIYLFVLVEPRYVGIFIVTLCLAVFSAFVLKGPVKTYRLSQFCIALILVLLLPAYISSGLYFKTAVMSSSVPGYIHVVEVMMANSIQPGDKVAYVGQKSRYQYWARLAHVQIAASMDDSRQFFQKEDQFIKFLKERKIKAVVTDAFSDGSAVPPNWQRINQEYQMRLLDSPIKNEG